MSKSRLWTWKLIILKYKKYKTCVTKKYIYNHKVLSYLANRGWNTKTARKDILVPPFIIICPNRGHYRGFSIMKLLIVARYGFNFGWESLAPSSVLFCLTFLVHMFDGSSYQGGMCYFAYNVYDVCVVYVNTNFVRKFYIFLHCSKK